MPSKHLLSLTEHGVEAPLLQYSPMCQVWAVTTYDACDIRCSYCHSLSQGVSRPRASAAEVQRILERELPAVPREHVMSLSPMIDCYPSVEAEHEVTRAALEVLASDRRRIGISTKGTLVERDLDLLSQCDDVIVNVALSSLDQGTLDEIEPHAPSAADRLSMVERLTEAGIETRLQVNPWIPGLSDAERFIDAAAGRFTVWFAALNVQNPVVARSRWGKRFTQQEIDDAFLAEMARIGPRPNVGWTLPAGADQTSDEPSTCGVRSTAGTVRAQRGGAAPALTRPSDAAGAQERDVASTVEILEALSSGRLIGLGLAKLSTHMRSYAANYPERRVAAEGPGLFRETAELVASLREPELTIHSLRAEAPVISATYAISGELAQPFHGYEAGQHVSSEAVATFRYDVHGLLIEHWGQAVLRTCAPDPVGG